MPWWGFNAFAAWKLLVRMWLVDKKQVIAWLVPIVARGIAWILSAKLGMTAAESTDAATQAGAAIGSLALIALSVYSSVKGRKALLMQEPPK